MLFLFVLALALGTHAFSPPLPVRPQLAVVTNGEKPCFNIGGAEISRTSSLLLADNRPSPPSAAVTGGGTGTALTALLVGIWYAASVKCNQTSKLLVASLGSQTLTLCQMLVAVGCGATILFGTRTFCALALDGECAFQPVGIECE